MRDATNQAGYHVQYYCEEAGWITAQVVPETDRAMVYTKDDANYAMLVLRSLAPRIEFRVYPALKEREC